MNNQQVDADDARAAGAPRAHEAPTRSRAARLRDVALSALPALVLFLFAEALLGDSDPMDSLLPVCAVLLGTGLAAGAALGARPGDAAWGAFLGQALAMFLRAAFTDDSASLWPLSLAFMALLAQVARLGVLAGRRLRPREANSPAS